MILSAANTYSGDTHV
ncbi:hypothetical protein ACMFDI_21410 [Klebsiella michiganensis]